MSERGILLAISLAACLGIWALLFAALSHVLAVLL